MRPDQCTLVPVAAGEITSQAGWQPGRQTEALADVIAGFKSRGIRVSLFVDPVPAPIEWAASVGADRVELYTEPFARAFERGREPPAGRRSRRSPRRRGWPTPSAWGSTPATISTWTT